MINNTKTYFDRKYGLPKLLSNNDPESKTPNSNENSGTGFDFPKVLSDPAQIAQLLLYNEDPVQDKIDAGDSLNAAAIDSVFKNYTTAMSVKLSYESDDNSAANSDITLPPIGLFYQF